MHRRLSNQRIDQAGVGLASAFVMVVSGESLLRPIRRTTIQALVARKRKGKVAVSAMNPERANG